MKFESRVARDESVVSPRIDPHEVEADQAADAVISGKSAAIRGQHSLGMRGAPSDSEIVPGEGESLDSSARAVMESRLGHDFSRVRVPCRFTCRCGSSEGKRRGVHFRAACCFRRREIQTRHGRWPTLARA